MYVINLTTVKTFDEKWKSVIILSVWRTEILSTQRCKNIQHFLLQALECEISYIHVAILKFQK